MTQTPALPRQSAHETNEQGGAHASGSGAPPGWLRVCNTIALVLFLGWILYDALGRNVFGDTPWPESIVDYRIMFEQSRKIAPVQQYDAAQIFPYAPPAVLFFFVTALPPFSIAAGLWLGLLVAAAIGVFVMGTALVGLKQSPVRWVAVLLAYAVTNNYFQWDLRSANCNSMYAALLVAGVLGIARGRNAAGGLFLAASVALKLYPVLTLPYLVWIGRYRAAIATIVGLLLLFIAVPCFYCGTGGCVRFYQSWFDQLRMATATTDLINHPILISIPHGLAKKFGQDSPLVWWIANGAKAFWVAVVALCLLSGGIRRARIRSGWELCIDAFALALLPVVASPYLESYHTVIAAPVVLAMLAYGVLTPFDRRRWFFSIVVVLAGWGLLYLFGQWKLRGLGVLAQMTVLLLGLAAARWKLRRGEQTAPSAVVSPGLAAP